MKRLIIILLSLITAMCSCSRAENEVLCVAHLKVVLPDGYGRALSITADNSLDGTFLTNVNTLEETPIPLFVGGEAVIQLLKGIYVIAFDGEALLEDGRVVKVRSVSHSTPEKAMRLVSDEASVELPLLVLK